MKINEYIKKYWLIALLMFLTIIRIIIIVNIPINAITPAAADDRLMALNGKSLIDGNWLGNYNQFTLAKGVMFPLFLKVSFLIGIPYMTSVTILYIIGCIVFAYMLRNIIKNKYFLSIIYILLLFNPAQFSSTIFTRVYRNVLTGPQVLLITGSFMLLYFKIEKKSKWFWTIISGFSFGFFYNTREDSMWLLPFLLFVIFITIIKVLIIYINKDRNIKKGLSSIICILISIFVIIIINNLISIKNYKEYGIYTTTDLSGTSFANAIKAIYSIKNEDELDYVTVTNKKLQKLFEISPTLKSIEPELIDSINLYRGADRNPTDNEIEDGWFYWALRYAMETAGYYETASKSEYIYQKIADEINEAIIEGKLETQNIMPSSLMSPWKDKYKNQIIKKILETAKYVISFKGLKIEPNESIGDNADGIVIFETVTNEKAIDPSNPFKDYEIKYYSYYTNRLNIIEKFYEKIAIGFTIIGIISYIVIIILTIDNIRKKEYIYLNTFLLTSGILGSLIVLFAGIAYTDISAFAAISPLTLSGAYPLIIALWTINLSVILETILNNKKKEIEKWKKKIMN